MQTITDCAADHRQGQTGQAKTQRFQGSLTVRPKLPTKGTRTRLLGTQSHWCWLLICNYRQWSPCLIDALRRTDCTSTSCGQRHAGTRRAEWNALTQRGLVHVSRSFSFTQFKSKNHGSHRFFLLSHFVAYAFGTVSGVWQQIQRGDPKAASMPCCCAANHIAARQLP